MSWSIYTAGLPADIAPRLDALEPPGAGTTEREDQVKVAREVAKTIITSHAVGDGEAFTVSLSGHSNPGHKGNDVVTVSVSQSTAATVQQYDQALAAALANEQ